jgi:hypothetical protein
MPIAECSTMDAGDQVVYDKGACTDRPAPMIGPAGVSLHMPKVAQATVDAIKFDRALQ